MYSLQNIKLIDFISVSKTNNYAIISKSKKKQKWLEDHWSVLEEDYKDLFKNTEKTKEETIKNEVSNLENKLLLIQNCCKQLLFSYNYILIDILKDNGFLIDEENYLESVNNAYKNAESINIKIAKKTNQLKNSSDKKVTAKNNIHDFDKTIITLCCVAEVRGLRPNDITVTEYKSILEIANQRIKELSHA